MVGHLREYLNEILSVVTPDDLNTDNLYRFSGRGYVTIASISSGVMVGHL